VRYVTKAEEESAEGSVQNSKAFAEMGDPVEPALMRERIEQFNLRLNIIGQLFNIYSAILGILLLLLGWGIFALYGKVRRIW
jgi:hypothetical protein